MNSRIVFVGCRAMGLVLLNWLLEKYPTEVVGVVTADELLEKKLAGFESFDSLMRGKRIGYLKVTDINDPGVVSKIAKWMPDLIVQVAWSQIIGDEVLKIPRFGTVGFHASLLPKNRGGSPVNWALIRGETAWGSTMFYLEPGIDNGDIVAQKRFGISLSDDCATVYEKVTKVNLQMLSGHIEKLMVGKARRTRQDESKASYNKRRKPGDGEFAFNQKSENIYNWVRALTHPYPGAFFRIGKEKIYVWKAAMAKNQAKYNEYSPGDIVRMDRRGRVLVKTADGVIALVTVSKDNDDEMPAYQFFSQ